MHVLGGGAGDGLPHGVVLLDSRGAGGRLSVAVIHGGPDGWHPVKQFV